MSDDVRTRISDVAAEHRFADHRTAFGDKCVCGWTSQDVPHSDHLADAVIRELGWRQERKRHSHPSKYRYVTEWTETESDD